MTRGRPAQMCSGVPRSVYGPLPLLVARRFWAFRFAPGADTVTATLDHFVSSVSSVVARFQPCSSASPFLFPRSTC
jgi:hypothetical protein